MKAPSCTNAVCRAANFSEPSFCGCAMKCCFNKSGCRTIASAIVVTMTPLMTGLWFGHKVLKISPLLLLGAISGAQTFTAGLAALQEKSGSPVAVLGYSGSVAVAHVVLTTWGTVMVLLVTR